MKSQPFIITEHHPSSVPKKIQTIRQTVVTWLTKELHK